MLIPPGCTANAFGAARPLAKSWQVWHDCRPEAESEVSAKIFAPSAEALLVVGSDAVPSPQPARRPASTVTARAGTRRRDGKREWETGIGRQQSWNARILFTN